MAGGRFFGICVFGIRAFRRRQRTPGEGLRTIAEVGGPPISGSSPRRSTT
jgi:hypothetical protein